MHPNLKDTSTETQVILENYKQRLRVDDLFSLLEVTLNVMVLFQQPTKGSNRSHQPTDSPGPV